jgi:bifunctional NMN adenylyltransferase/nudix hydrolase
MTIETARPDICIFVGRFQPLHQGHVCVMREALRRADRLLVLVGSANEPRSFRNPFTAEERASLIIESLAPEDRSRVAVMPLEDSDYDLSAWIRSVRQSVAQAWQDRFAGPASPEPAISLIGHSKDASSYYLKLFPDWGAIDVPHVAALDATAIRAELFGDESVADALLEGAAPQEGDYLDRYSELALQRAQSFLSRENGLPEIPPAVASFLSDFVASADYRRVTDEFAHVARYRHQWRAAPYPPTFVTADAVVVQSGQVLVVNRNGFPGRGLWAVPGGFVDRNEFIEDAMLRELAEETGIDVPPAILRSRIVAREVFDNPHRSSRGRTITHAFLIHLEPGAQPGVAGADDAAAAEWMPLSRLDRSRFFEDHHSIIRKLVSRL